MASRPPAIVRRASFSFRKIALNTIVKSG
jgi:hypothetical protein